MKPLYRHETIEDMLDRICRRPTLEEIAALEAENATLIRERDRLHRMIEHNRARLTQMRLSVARPA